MVNPFWATSLDVDNRAGGFLGVLLSLKSLFTCIILFGALVSPPPASVSGFFRVLVSSLGCFLSFVYTWSLSRHSVVLSTCCVLFCMVFLTGLTPWDGTSCAVALDGSYSLLACVAGCPPLV